MQRLTNQTYMFNICLYWPIHITIVYNIGKLYMTLIIKLSVYQTYIHVVCVWVT